jgi:hypothetical protein
LVTSLRTSMLSRVPISPDDVKFGGKLVDKLVLPLGASLNCYVYEIYTRDRTGRCEFE